MPKSFLQLSKNYKIISTALEDLQNSLYSSQRFTKSDCKQAQGLKTTSLSRKGANKAWRKTSKLFVFLRHDFTDREFSQEIRAAFGE
jgi:hypothetical protein